MKSRAVGRFWRLYDKLPAEIRRTADKQFALWLNNPRHRSLRFKQVRPNLAVVALRARSNRLADTRPLMPGLVALLPEVTAGTVTYVPSS
jgi:hypothetical protein